MTQELIALVLAGGAGTRFWPLTTDKILFPFIGKPLFTLSVLDSLPKAVTKMVVVTNDRNRQYISNMKCAVPIVTVLQREAQGMADAILAASSEIAGKSVLLLIADDLIDISLLNDIVNTAKKSSAFAIIPGWKSKQYFPGGYLQMKSNQITGILEKPGEGNEPSPYVNISGHFIRNADILLEALKQKMHDGDDVYEQALTSLMPNHECIVYPYEGDFASLKYPWHVLQVMDTILAHRIHAYQGKNVVIKSNVIIEGDVYIEDDVKIFEHTKITGPCYIGKGTIIGNNNIIRHSIIGANCVTGFNTDITRSYIGDNCWFHSNYIGDSVLESDISMGSGAVLANLRLDESEISSAVKGKKQGTKRNKLGAIIGKQVRIGINASIMPGVKIGTGSFVGSGVVLDKDIPDGSFCMAQPAYILRRNEKQIDPQAREAFKKHIG